MEDRERISTENTIKKALCDFLKTCRIHEMRFDPEYANTYDEEGNITDCETTGRYEIRLTVHNLLR